MSPAAPDKTKTAYMSDSIQIRLESPPGRNTERFVDDGVVAADRNVRDKQPTLGCESDSPLYRRSRHGETGRFPAHSRRRSASSEAIYPPRVQTHEDKR